MGNYQALEVDLENTQEVRRSSVALKIHYNDTKIGLG